MTKLKMAINSVKSPRKKRAIFFKSFAELIVIFFVIQLDIVASNIEHHHNNHVCNHQHPKAHDVRHHVVNIMCGILFGCFFSLSFYRFFSFFLHHTIYYSHWIESDCTKFVAKSYVSERQQFLAKFIWWKVNVHA